MKITKFSIKEGKKYVKEYSNSSDSAPRYTLSNIMEASHYDSIESAEEAREESGYSSATIVKVKISFTEAKE